MDLDIFVDLLPIFLGKELILIVIVLRVFLLLGSVISVLFKLLLQINQLILVLF